jgi:hypothetical protein
VKHEGFSTLYVLEADDGEVRPMGSSGRGGGHHRRWPHGAQGQAMQGHSEEGITQGRMTEVPDEEV